MKSGIRIIIASLIASCSSLTGAEAIEGFLGLKFGADRETAKTTMVERGFKLKDHKSEHKLEFEKGSYAGQPLRSLVMEFTNNRFNRATAVFEVSSGKREECVRLGLKANDSVRDQLTSQYGNPTSVKSVSRSKLRDGKDAGSSMFSAAWRSKGAVNGGERSITLSTVTIGLYSWVFNVVYDDGAPKAEPQGGL
ncbi:hypothetical protein OKA05_24375 [Luteolibacter arcticus]|uniref:Lipoprotein n=1 Tax=Luteolibacter arcticus TaxID=1581411 RepID=A0ABT3GQF7_9BACT|nr:hypothetical protein [Luteolibacter arcticus]MCW1925717.1 hypothetical protein [Luteolibacter arcticus]